MSLLKSLGIALSAFSIIPVPRFEWSQENMRFSICFLPVVGFIVGLLLFAWGLFCAAMEIGVVLFAAGATLIPLLLTGGIHMDGFCDCIDALSSRRDREKMLEILKDPHAGAFAVIYCAVYVLAVFGLYSELHSGVRSAPLSGTLLSIVCCGFVLSRALAALSAVCIPSATNTGFLASFTKSAHKKAIAISMSLTALLACAAMGILSFFSGSLLPSLAAIVCAALAFFLYRHMALRKFGGITGDTTGYFIQVCELAILIGGFSGHLASGFLV